MRFHGVWQNHHITRFVCLVYSQYLFDVSDGMALSLLYFLISKPYGVHCVYNCFASFSFFLFSPGVRTLSNFCRTFSCLCYTTTSMYVRVYSGLKLRQYTSLWQGNYAWKFKVVREHIQMSICGLPLFKRVLSHHITTC